jgi:drug/metabolite transporter (DMT)-like permease
MTGGMPLSVTLLVLAAAAMHAAWNALVKAGKDKLLDTATISAGAGLMAAAALPFLPLPAPASWPWMAASVVLHAAYFYALIGAYRWGELSVVYPLMRGLAPLLTALMSASLAGEALTPGLGTGVLLISAGILVPAFLRGGPPRTPPQAIGFALGNAVIIMGYTLVDGLGARASGHAVSYSLWLFLFDAVPLCTVALLLRGRPALRHARAHWRYATLGATFTVISYTIVLWAMTRAPVAAVAALRETSVIFAAVIGSLWLKEDFGLPRIAGAVLVAAGIVALRL